MRMVLLRSDSQRAEGEDEGGGSVARRNPPRGGVFDGFFVSAIWRFDGTKGQGCVMKYQSTDPSSDVQDDARTKPEEEQWLRCRACGARITRRSASIVVNGTHEHTFMNPSGITYIVGCWSSAEGCSASGERSTVWTWFPGFAWQIEDCRACRAHLGWSFHKDGRTFYGLIRDRLV
jgi:hypothetical protein